MRVKPEQAPKAAMWMPTRRETGEGCMDREEPGAGARQHDNHRAPSRSTGVVGTARQKGNQCQWGRLGVVAELRTANAACKGSGPPGRRRGSDVPVKPGNAGRGKDPCFWCVCKEGKTRGLTKVWERRIRFGNFRSNCIERRRASRTSASISFTTRCTGQTFCGERGCW